MFVGNDPDQTKGSHMLEMTINAIVRLQNGIETLSEKAEACEARYGDAGIYWDRVDALKARHDRIMRWRYERKRVTA